MLRDPFDIYPETSPADALDALYGLAQEHGAPRSVNGLVYTGDGAMFGRAVTLRSLPSRPDHNETIARRTTQDWGAGAYPYAMSLCDERSVLVIEARGMLHYAAGGGTGLSSLLGRRAAGLLTDGQIRDGENLARHAKATGTKLVTGGYTLQYGTERMLMPSDVNVPVAIRDTLVLPGDFVFGNADGTVVIPADMAEEVLETAVVLARSAEVMEDMLIEQRGIIGIDLRGITDEVVQEMKTRFEFSERQLELWDKNVTGVA